MCNNIDRYRRATCETKRTFSSQVKAFRYLMKDRKTGILKEDHRVYRCPFCRKWHIGSKGGYDKRPEGAKK